MHQETSATNADLAEPCRAALSGAVVRGLGLRHQRQLCVGGDIADIPVVVDETDPAVAPLKPHYVARLRIGAVFEDHDHLPTLEPMSSPSMANPMRRAPTSLLAPPDADPRHHTRGCLRRERGRLRGRVVAVPKLELLAAQ